MSSSNDPIVIDQEIGATKKKKKKRRRKRTHATKSHEIYKLFNFVMFAKVKKYNGYIEETPSCPTPPILQLPVVNVEKPKDLPLVTPIDVGGGLVGLLINKYN